MTDSIIAEIAKVRPHDTWLEMKLSELNTEYQHLLEDHHRLVRDNSKLRTNINCLRSGMDEIPEKPIKQLNSCIFKPILIICHKLLFVQFDTQQQKIHYKR